jgi:hypothetical protein
MMKSDEMRLLPMLTTMMEMMEMCKQSAIQIGIGDDLKLIEEEDQ